MFNIPEPLTLISLLTLASAEPSAVCKMPKPTAINVKPSTKPVKYDLTQTREEIQKQSIDTVNPYGFDAQSFTNAYMKGGIRTAHSVKLNHKMVLSNRGACLWYDTVEIKIEIDPTIVIAKEVAADKCEYSAVKTHELKHVAVDRKVVNKYSKIMGKKIYEGLKARGFMVGPVPVAQAKEVAQRMQQTVGQLLELEFRKMEIERAELQQGIDTLEEYEYVNSKCNKSKTISASRRRPTYSR